MGKGNVCIISKNLRKSDLIIGANHLCRSKQIHDIAILRLKDIATEINSVIILTLYYTGGGHNDHPQQL